MDNLKKLKYILLFCLSISSVKAQYEIEPTQGYSTNVGNMVAMMEDLKARITQQVKDLSQEETDFLFDEKANSIGALIVHIAATEDYYRVQTIEERPWTQEEKDLWGSGELGDFARERFKGQPIKFYLDLWDEVREKTLEGLKKKDDAWFAIEIEKGVNNHWVWYHVMEHSANHMGQIALVKNRMK